MEMSEGWKKLKEGAEFLKANGNGDNFIKAADLMQEMAKAMQHVSDMLAERATMHYSLEVALKKFKEWK